MFPIRRVVSLRQPLLVLQLLIALIKVVAVSPVQVYPIRKFFFFAPSVDLCQD